jgi:excisionase family DNA binding protein
VNSRRELPALMTPAKVAAAWKVSPKTVTRWAAAGRLPFIRTLGGASGPGHRRYRRAEVEALLNGTPVRSGS